MDLLTKINSNRAVVGVIGLGYVGLPVLRVFCNAGFRVIGFDTDAQKISDLKSGRNYLQHLEPGMVMEMNETGRFDATGDMSRLRECDAVVSCVPTPLGKHREPDLSYVECTANDIATSLHEGQLVVLESSTYPGTTRDILLPHLARTGLICGKDFYLAYSPEREDPGRQDHTTATIPKLLGGIDKASGLMAFELYDKAFEKVVLVSSAEVAESAKMLENVYRAVNISLVNEMKIVLTELGIDIWEVIAAASTKPFGFQPFFPGPGLGGHCIPIDPYYFAWKARQTGLSARLVELAGEVNRQMPNYVLKRTILALNQQAKAIKGSSILILGLAYKPDVDDVRESPSFKLIHLLVSLGANVEYHDPFVKQTQKTRRYDLQMRSIELSATKLTTYDCVIVVTNHSCYDWQLIADHAKLIIDTRNALNDVTGDRTHISGA